MHRPHRLILAMAAIALPALARAETRTIAVAPFTQMLSEGSANVIVTTGPRMTVTAQGSARALARLRIGVERGLLSIGEVPAGWMDWRPWTIAADQVTVRVTAPALRAARLAGSGDLAIDRVAGPAFGLSLSGSGDARLGAVAVRRLALALAGSGDIEAGGRVDDVTIALHGSGDVRAGRLRTDTATVTLAGTGDITIDARGGVSGALAGSGNLSVTGQGGCNIVRAGTGTVHCANDRPGGTR